jgi:TolB protein
MRKLGLRAALVCTVACVAALGAGVPAAAGLGVAPLPANGVPAGADQAMAPAGTQEAASAIPWGDVGPGWFVALWGEHAGIQCCPPPHGWQDQSSTLFLVDPLGGRYRIATWAAPSEYTLYDWSGDGARVLIGTPTGTAARPRVEDIALATGKVLHTFAEVGSAWYQYTRPDGLAVLASPYEAGDAPQPVVRLTLSGATELTYPTRFPIVGPTSGGLSGGGLLPSLDGTELVVAAQHGMALLANNGTFIRRVGPSQLCYPDRWWDASDLVASCDGGSRPALWLVPVDGARATQLTSPRGQDEGDLDGWRVGTTVYTQAAGACAAEFLARRLADGQTEAVTVPGTGGDVHVVGAHGSELALQAKLGCGSAPTLFWFNPATAKETPLLGPPVNGGGVLSVLPYPGLEP